MSAQHLLKQVQRTPAAKRHESACTNHDTLWGGYWREATSKYSRTMAWMDRQVHGATCRTHMRARCFGQIMGHQHALLTVLINGNDAASQTCQRQNSNNYTHTLNMGMSPVFSKIGAITC